MKSVNSLLLLYLLANAELWVKPDELVPQSVSPTTWAPCEYPNNTILLLGQAATYSSMSLVMSVAHTISIGRSQCFAVLIKRTGNSSIYARSIIDKGGGILYAHGVRAGKVLFNACD